MALYITSSQSRAKNKTKWGFVRHFQDYKRSPGTYRFYGIFRRLVTYSSCPVYCPAAYQASGWNNESNVNAPISKSYYFSIRMSNLHFLEIVYYFAIKSTLSLESICSIAGSVAWQVHIDTKIWITFWFGTNHRHLPRLFYTVLLKLQLQLI